MLPMNACMNATDQADARVLALPASQSASLCGPSAVHSKFSDPHGSFCRVLMLTLEGVEGSNQARKQAMSSPQKSFLNVRQKKSSHRCVAPGP